MALDVINSIKAAEEKALETKRAAAIAAKDSVKLAAMENREILEKELQTLRQSCASSVEAEGIEAKKELEARKKQHDKECEDLKAKAAKNLSRAADACLERILK